MAERGNASSIGRERHADLVQIVRKARRSRTGLLHFDVPDERRRSVPSRSSSGASTG